jgi:hypothetical protein
VVDLGGLGVKKFVSHWHLLAIGLESYGVASGSYEAVNEHGRWEVDVSQAGLEVECTRLSDVIPVELDKERILVAQVDPQLMRCLGKQEVPIRGWSPVIGRVKLPLRCPTVQLDVGQ